MSASGRDRSILFVAALLPILGSVFALSVGGRFASNEPILIALLLAGGLGWILATSLARRGGGDFGIVVAGAIALRILAWSGDAGLSDDVHRYLWEGEVVVEGASPYTSAPDAGQAPWDSATSDLRQKYPQLWERVSHKEVRAAYPPLAQAAGAMAAALCRWFDAAPETTGASILRTFFGACDLLVLWPLAKILERARLPRALAVVWGWSPLPSIEFAGSGHLDSLGILLLVGALATGLARTSSRSEKLEDGRFGFVPLALLSAGILTKYLPAVALPWFLKGRRAIAKATFVAVLCAAGFGPFLLLHGSTNALFSGLGEYAFRWESGSLLHRWIEPVFARVFDRDESWSDPRRLARVSEAIAWLTFAFVVARRERDPARGVGAMIGAWLILSPTLHPWYLCWMLPFLALRASAAWLWLILVTPLLYWPLEGWQSVGVWSEPPWLWAVVALPFFGILALERLARGRARWRVPLPIP